MKPRRCSVSINKYNEERKWVATEHPNSVCHGFFPSADGSDEYGPVAVVELEDGSVTTVDPCKVKFTEPLVDEKVVPA